MAVSVTGKEANKFIAFNKCKKVIESCENITQLNVAEVYVNLFCKMYFDGIMAIMLDDMISQQVIITVKY
tara:strand:+ start:148 stop:357 length:210 start_codon:yes stop_codon:yes gene_type:complete